MPPSVSLAVVNARVKTNDPSRPWANGIAVTGDQISFVGSSAEIKKIAGTAARVVDAGGRVLLSASPDGNDPADVVIASQTPANFMVVDHEPPANSTWSNPGFRVLMRVVRGMVLENTLA